MLILDAATGLRADDSRAIRGMDWRTLQPAIDPSFFSRRARSQHLTPCIAMLLGYLARAVRFTLLAPIERRAERRIYLQHLMGTMGVADPEADAPRDMPLSRSARADGLDTPAHRLPDPRRARRASNSYRVRSPAAWRRRSRTIPSIMPLMPSGHAGSGGCPSHI